MQPSDVWVAWVADESDEDRYADSSSGEQLGDGDGDRVRCFFELAAMVCVCVRCGSAVLRCMQFSQVLCMKERASVAARFQGDPGRSDMDSSQSRRAGRWSTTTPDARPPSMQRVLATVFAEHLDRSTPTAALTAHCFTRLVDDLVARGWCTFVIAAVEAVEYDAEYARHFLVRVGQQIALAMMPEVEDVSSSPFRAFLYVCNALYGCGKLCDSDEVKAFFDSSAPLEL